MSNTPKPENLIRFDWLCEKCGEAGQIQLPRSTSIVELAAAVGHAHSNNNLNACTIAPITKRRQLQLPPELKWGLEGALTARIRRIRAALQMLAAEVAPQDVGLPAAPRTQDIVVTPQAADSPPNVIPIDRPKNRPEILDQ